MSRLRFAALLLTGVALSACSGTSEPANMTQNRGRDGAMSGELDTQLRRAQLLRAQGDLAEATRAIAQMMIAVPDDPRVVGEYGKLLAQKGQPEDAIAFLRRASELNSNDWTVYSAMGVAYDQLHDPNQARIAYDRALSLKPNEPSVLNNFAMSRMLANDLPQASRLIQMAKASGNSDPKIQRNAEMIASLMPRETSKPATIQTPAVATAPVAAPVTPVARRETPKPVAKAAIPPVQAGQPAIVPTPQPVRAAQPFVAPASQPAVTQDTRQPTGAPRTLQQRMGANFTPLRTADAKPTSRKMGPQVMMQEVPFDPLAGPVAKRAEEKPIKLKQPVKRSIAKNEKPKVSKPKVDVAKSEITEKTKASKVQAARNEAKTEQKTTAKAENKPELENKKPVARPVKTQFAEKSDARTAADGIPRLRMAADSE